ncbi:hypothetical protein [Arsenicibacter rosenii]|uniref:Terminase n=1 Tax=Arsenicibacter rosenii TaxID=1750698 RepID=A0A1S2VGZ6_9BACT|nr:hypothetical protein [Arsenicibacter rosenii]OIN58002.1 hypothetical protein BLX24_15810 [Arsenicibacter rosenii]
MESKPQETKKNRRPTKYKPENAQLAYQLCLLGLTDNDMATFFEVTEQTINNWKQSFPEFFESVKKGKIVADANVAASLYKRGTGYEFTEVTNEEDEQGRTRTKVVRKHIPADTTAAIFWLKNRQPKVWRDKQEIKLSGSIAVNDLRDLTDDELAKLKADLERQNNNEAN